MSSVYYWQTAVAISVCLFESLALHLGWRILPLPCAHYQSYQDICSDVSKHTASNQRRSNVQHLQQGPRTLANCFRVTQLGEHHEYSSAGLYTSTHDKYLQKFRIMPHS
ncbi:hypothetical protein A0H81_14062 [Grifola frondosa]|uniref:Uncharacterized protein n=1 Tax=Grifola frondosa TaxID=5627 RepID=A0A1C7LPL4_GRIFR|nr:hypothetical protein A0H81_14062 [Grifola frondosa]